MTKEGPTKMGLFRLQLASGKCERRICNRSISCNLKIVMMRIISQENLLSHEESRIQSLT